MTARIKLGDLLVRAGVLDEFKLKAALAEQHRWGGRLGKILIEMNFVSEDVLVKALSKQLGIPRARLDHIEVPAQILARIDPGIAQQNGVCPERYLADKKTLVIAMSDPSNVGIIDELRFKTGLRIETTIAGDFEITQAIERIFYGRGPIDGIELDGVRSVTEDEQLEMPTRQMRAMSPQQLAAIQAAQAVQAAQAAHVATLQAQAIPTTANSGYMPAPSMSTSGYGVAPSMSTSGYVPAAPGSNTSYGAIPQFAQVAQAAAQVAPVAPVTQGAPLPRASSMAPPPPRGGASQVQPRPSAAPAQPTAKEMAVMLEAAQKKQLKAIRVLLEMLIEKRIISKEDYVAQVNRR